MAGGDELGPGAVGVEADRPDRCLRRGRHHHRAGAVAEEPRGAPIVVIGHPADDLGADHEHAASAARLDRAAGELERREKPGAGRTDVHRPGAFGAEPGSDQRAGVRQQVVLAAGGDQDQVEVPRLGAGALERRRAGLRGEIDERFAGRRHPPLAHAGSRADPVRLDPEPRRDLAVTHGPRRHRGGDRRDRRARRLPASPVPHARGLGDHRRATHGPAPARRHPRSPRRPRPSCEPVPRGPFPARRHRSARRRPRAGGSSPPPTAPDW